MFLLDFVEPLPAETSSIVSEPCSFVAKLSTNLLIICPKSAPVLEDLKKCKEVQSRNIQTLVSAAYQAKAAVGGTPFVLPSSADPVDAVIQDGRPLLLCDFNGALKNSRVRDLSRLALERVLSGLGNRVILSTVADPVSKSFGIEREQWDTLLQSFVRIDLPSGSVQGAEQSLKELGTAISDDAYQRWFFPRRSRSEKLVLVHLAQEKVVNPNSRSVLCQLMREGVVDRNSGLVAIKDTGFERFLQSAVPPDIIKHWENKGASARSTSLRTSLVVLGLGIAGFLYYTQGEVFNTWVTYATGLTASIPALLRVFSNLRGKSDAEA